MSTLDKIKIAVDRLSLAEQKALLQSVAERVHRSEALVYDPVTEIIGTFPSVASNDTARRDEDILYGHDEAK